MANTIISNNGRSPKLVSNLKDCTLGPVTFLGYKDKRTTTGVWERVRFNDGQVGLIETGHLASLHNDGIAKIFADDVVEPDATVEFRTDVQMGIKDGDLIFEEVK